MYTRSSLSLQSYCNRDEVYPSDLIWWHESCKDQRFVSAGATIRKKIMVCRRPMTDIAVFFFPFSFFMYSYIIIRLRRAWIVVSILSKYVGMVSHGMESLKKDSRYSPPDLFVTGYI